MATGTHSTSSSGGSLNTTFSIAATSNQLSGVTGALSRTYSYDAAGHTTAYGEVSFTYNGAGRLIRALNGTATSSYLYNALGQRVRKTTAAGNTVFLYDESGHLQGEYGFRWARRASDDQGGVAVGRVLRFGTGAHCKRQQLRRQARGHMEPRCARGPAQLAQHSLQESRDPY
jgi:YD repeat-containing protein